MASDGRASQPQDSRIICCPEEVFPHPDAVPRQGRVAAVQDLVVGKTVGLLCRRPFEQRRVRAVHLPSRGQNRLRVAIATSAPLSPDWLPSIRESIGTLDVHGRRRSALDMGARTCAGTVSLRPTRRLPIGWSRTITRLRARRPRGSLGGFGLWRGSCGFLTSASGPSKECVRSGSSRHGPPS